jgi:hypothetical protein
MELNPNSKIFAAFVKAQMAFGPALKTSVNPAFRSKYARLDNCIEAVIDALNNNGIGLLQVTHPDDKGVTVETLFIHESGEQMSGGVFHVPAQKQDPQGYGSALTYARRFSLMAACGIAPEDDDGEAAMQPYRQPANTRNQPEGVPAPKPRVGEAEQKALSNALLAAGIETKEFCKLSKIKDLSQLPLDKFAGAMDYIKKQAQGDAA